MFCVKFWGIDLEIRESRINRDIPEVVSIREKSG